MECSYASAYEKIKLRLPNLDIQLQPMETVSWKQRQARQSLCQIRREAQIKCKEFLNTLLQVAKVTKNDKWKQLILGLKQAEENRRCFSTVCQLLSPSTPGRLSQLLSNTITHGTQQLDNGARQSHHGGPPDTT